VGVDAQAKSMEDDVEKLHRLISLYTCFSLLTLVPALKLASLLGSKLRSIKQIAKLWKLLAPALARKRLSTKRLQNWMVVSNKASSYQLLITCSTGLRKRLKEALNTYEGEGLSAAIAEADAEIAFAKEWVPCCLVKRIVLIYRREAGSIVGTQDFYRKLLAEGTTSQACGVCKRPFANGNELKIFEAAVCTCSYLPHLSLL
jgi:hypothetical protein